MRRDWILSVSSACLLAWSPCSSQTVESPDVEVIDARPERSPDEKVPDLKAVARGLVDRTNAFRAEEKRPRLTVNPKLADTARDFAAYMAETDRYGHTADGGNPGVRANKHAYEYGLISENIAYAFNTDGFTARELAVRYMEGWEHSPGHRENMLDPDATETGMAVARSEKSGYYYAVQMFARPRSRGIQVELVNRSDATIVYRLGDRAFELPPHYSQTHEQGRPAELAVELPSKEKPLTKTFKVEGKARFVILEEMGTPRIVKESPDRKPPEGR
jgi:uncharacterized protein YkwD